jgi:hypothetical protein
VNISRLLRSILLVACIAALTAAATTLWNADDVLLPQPLHLLRLACAAASAYLAVTTTCTALVHVLCHGRRSDMLTPGFVGRFVTWTIPLSLSGTLVFSAPTSASQPAQIPVMHLVTGNEPVPTMPAHHELLPQPSGQPATDPAGSPGLTNPTEPSTPVSNPAEQASIPTEPSRPEAGSSGPSAPVAGRSTPANNPAEASAPAAGLAETPTTADPASSNPASVEHVVQVGENFWSIADDQLRQQLGAPPDDRQLSTYWQQLVEQNRHRLHDPSNPDLLRPGQRILLP